MKFRGNVFWSQAINLHDHLTYQLLDGQDMHLQSEKLDLVFGYQIQEIEHALHMRMKELRPEGDYKSFWKSTDHGHQTWVGLNRQTLQTPYSEWEKILRLLDPKPQETIMDLGAGYGRGGLILRYLYPECSFVGFEYVPERVKEANRILKLHECSRAKVIEADLVKMKIPQAQTYFLYDFGHAHEVQKVLFDLGELSKEHPFKVVTWGRLVRSMVDLENPWLETEAFDENFSIYSTY